MVQWLNATFGQTVTVGRETFVPSIETPDRIFSFPLKAVRLMYYMATAPTVDEAAEKAAVSKAFARRFFKSRDFVEFREMALRMQAVRNGWTTNRVIFELDRVYKGQVRLDSRQFDALRELREIVLPRTTKVEGMAPGVSINIQMPELPKEVQAKLKAIADEAATSNDRAA